MTIDKSTMQTIADDAALAVTVATPFLPPNALLALLLAKAAISAIEASMNSGQDITDAQLDELFDVDAQAAAADILARQQKTTLALAKEPTKT